MDPVVVGTMAEGKLSEITLKVITTNGSICQHHEELFLLRPTKSFDGAFGPRDTAKLLASVIVNIYARLDSFRRLVLLEFGIVIPKCCASISTFIDHLAR